MLSKIEVVKDVIIDLIDRLTVSQPWWVEIHTQTPQCIYYFGPFERHQEAKQAQDGYVEDLVAEQAIGISVTIKQYDPKVLTELTVFEE